MFQIPVNIFIGLQIFLTLFQILLTLTPVRRWASYSEGDISQAKEDGGESLHFVYCNYSVEISSRVGVMLLRL